MEPSCLASLGAPKLRLVHSRPAGVRGPWRDGMGTGPQEEGVNGAGLLRIRPLEGLRAARVSGLDAAVPPTAGQLHALRHALVQHGVLLCYGRQLDAAALADLAGHLGSALPRDGTPASLLHAGAAPHSGGDAVWLQLAEACDLLGAGTRREVGDVELTTYNPFLHRLRLRTAVR